MTGPQFRAVGRQSVLAELRDQEQVHRVWSAWRARQDPDVEEVVAGDRSVLVTVRAGCDPWAVIRRLAEAPPPAEGAGATEVVIEVDYDGADLADVAALTGLAVAEVIARHCGSAYTVAFLGFSPGFAYLIGGDPVLDVPRLERPRTTVPAGSVAIAAGLSAVYPQSTPGGWRLLGRTEAVLFDHRRRPPALLAPGDRVRFQPVRTRPGRPVTHRTATPPAATPTPPAAPAAASGRPARYLRILEPGPFTTVQDGGRVGWAHVGVPRAGAADRSSAERANLLVGNRPGAAVLEATMAGPHLVLGAPCLIAVTGGRASVTVDGLPARQDTALALPAGTAVSVGPVTAGLRVYIAVSGGVQVEAVLGSRSTDTLAGLGPPPVSSGDVLALGPPEPPPPDRISPTVPPADTPFGGPGAAGGWIIEVAAQIGPRHAAVGPAGLEVLGGAEFVVHPSSDRTGLRLAGPAVPVRDLGALPSEPMVAGAVQVPHGGAPIVLLRNHPTTGGYPVAAVVDDAGVDRLAQARPGDRVRIRLDGDPEPGPTSATAPAATSPSSSPSAT